MIKQKVQQGEITPWSGSLNKYADGAFLSCPAITHRPVFSTSVVYLTAGLMSSA